MTDEPKKIDYYSSQEAEIIAAEPRWPSQSLSELIEKAFAGCMIEDANHPGLARLALAYPVESKS